MNGINHIPLELMQTFVKIVDNGGDATAAAQELGISQPGISKRLSALRRIVADVADRQWLILKGKRWLLTSNGERVRGVVTELVRKSNHKIRLGQGLGIAARATTADREGDRQLAVDPA